MVFDIGDFGIADNESQSEAFAIYYCTKKINQIMIFVKKKQKLRMGLGIQEWTK